MKKFTLRILSLVLVLALLPLPFAAALTPQEALDLLEQYYIDELPDSVRNASTVEEMLSALGDRYTQYMTAEEYAAFLDSMNDTSTVGIGVSLRVEDAGARILTVYPYTPASEAGLQSGDLITQADGVDLAGVTDVSQYIAGAAGTQVALTVHRGDYMTMHLTLTRRQVDIIQTLGALVDGHVGFITCNSFSDTTASHFDNILTRYENAANVWIVDLRQNGGGLTQGAADAAARFAGNSIMAYFRDSSGRATVSIPKADDHPVTAKPAILLVGESTASAAELFSGALRDYGRAIIIGSRTYGKGVAQVLLNQDTHPELFSGDAFKITAYRFYAPYCGTNDRLGVLPTLLVDDDLAEDVALLLSEKMPNDSRGYFRLDLCGMTFYIDGEKAASKEHVAAFRELLYAIPPIAVFYRGTGGNTWMTASPEDTALLETGSLTPRTFGDVQSSPHRTAIQTLAVYGIARSVSGDSFYPNDAITRGELSLMLARLLRSASSGTARSFPDVPAESELASAVSTLTRLGILQGYGDGYFRPDAPVTQQELAVILARTAFCMELNANYYFSLADGDLPLTDKSFAPFAGWAKKGVWLDGYLGILWDDVSALRPAASATREQAAASLYALMRFCGLVPLSA